jgi:hypothetical protein
VAGALPRGAHEVPPDLYSACLPLRRQTQPLGAEGASILAPKAPRFGSAYFLDHMTFLNVWQVCHPTASPMRKSWVRHCSYIISILYVLHLIMVYYVSSGTLSLKGGEFTMFLIMVVST